MRIIWNTASSTTLPRPAASGTPSSAKPLRGFHADDMAKLRDPAHRAGNEGHQLETCSNGALACEQLRLMPETYDLLITDHHMPVMIGLNLYARFVTCPTKALIIVFSSELSQTVSAIRN